MSNKTPLKSGEFVQTPPLPALERTVLKQDPTWVSPTQRKLEKEMGVALEFLYEGYVDISGNPRKQAVWEVLSSEVEVTTLQG